MVRADSPGVQGATWSPWGGSRAAAAASSPGGGTEQTSETPQTSGAENTDRDGSIPKVDPRNFENQVKGLWARSRATDGDRPQASPAVRYVLCQLRQFQAATKWDPCSSLFLLLFPLV